LLQAFKIISVIRTIKARVKRKKTFLEKIDFLPSMGGQHNGARCQIYR
jgi:hypothetical protein